MDVGGWLRGLGLGKYEESFRANAIDADLLPRLTVDDLKDIGVSVVGDRRRLLDAIAVIAGAGRSADVPASPTKSAPSKGLQASAERRPITVMFCDLVGSTSLAAKLDAEDWRNLVNAYLDEASGAVTGLGGHVLKKLGDGLMALFGYPQAQENDAERAVRAALAIQRALADLNARSARSGAPELSARIGIECGSVVVDANGEVFGEAPNVAARVQAAAEPGSVLVTGSVQRQVAGLFVVEEKGAHGFKGVAQPLSLYRVVRASGGGRRGGLRALTQFVGREEELGFLARRWERVRAGEGQLVLIVGEPGLGKSRLIEEFHSRLAETRHTWVEWSASQLLQNTPLHPIAEWGRFRFGADAPAEQRLADLEGTLRLIGLGPAEYAPLLAPLVDIPLPLGRAAHFPPEELRRKQLAAMTAWSWLGRGLHCEQALATCSSECDLEARERSGEDTRAVAMAMFALASWQLGEVDRARELIEAANRRAAEIAHVPSMAVPLHLKSLLEIMRGDAAAALTASKALEALSREHGMALQEIWAEMSSSWARGRLHDPKGGAARLQRALGALAEIGGAVDTAFFLGLLAQLEAEAFGIESASARVDEAFALSNQVESRSYLSFLHRLRGDVLLKRDPDDTSSAEDAFREAIAVAKEQSARSYQLQAALPLAKLYQSTDRPAEAHAVLAPALEGFSPTPEMPEIAEAEALLEALAEMEEVKVAASQQQRQAQLQIAYGNALIAARGPGSPETTDAFAKARGSAFGATDAPERLAADYGLWASSYTRGESPLMRAYAAAFFSDVEPRPDCPRPASRIGLRRHLALHRRRS